MALVSTIDGPIFHIADPRLWQQALGSGSYVESTRDATLADVGYVHCSFAHQVELVAGYIYADWPADLVLLQIDATQLASPVRVENLAGGTDEFPHVYGPIPCDAVTRVHDLARSDGRWRLPDGL
jgi:uncharacterized protein (DUF952 family)